MAVVVPLTVVVSFSVLRSMNALREAAERQSNYLTRSLTEAVDIALRQEIKIVKSIAADPVFGSSDTDAMTRRLVALMDAIGGDYEILLAIDAQGIVQGDSRGGTDIGNDVSQRQYFTDAVNGKTTIGNPVRSIATGNPVVVAATPVYGEENEFSGLICAVINIDFLIDIIGARRE